MEQHISKVLTELQVKKEHLPQELKHSVSGEELALEKAINSSLIKSSSVEEIKQVLRLVMLKLGLRERDLPSDEEKFILIEHIISNFGGNRAEEIKLAFDMAISGKLDLPESETTCYANFSCLYFTKIMSSYQRWASQAARHVQIGPPPDQKIYTDAELEDFQREDAERQYQLFLSRYDVKSLEINKAILGKDNLLNPSESVVDFFKRKRQAGYQNIYVKTKKDRP